MTTLNAQGEIVPAPLITCTKRYSDIPFAHRQPNHDGHCAQIHGHNWSFQFTFGARLRDANNFVVDFGGLKWLKTWLGRFDHALVICEADPKREWFIKHLHMEDLARIVVVADASSEGLCQYVGEHVSHQLGLVEDYTQRGVRLVRLTVYEDHRNSATIEF